MRKVTVTCDRCGFKKTYNDDKYAGDELRGWACICTYGPYKDVEICPECVKSFFGVTKLEEVTEDD